MKRISCLLVLLCCIVFTAGAQQADSVAMAKKMKEMEARVSELEARLKALDPNMLTPPPPPPGAPRTPGRKQKIVIINGERMDSLPENLDVLKRLDLGSTDSLVLSDGLKIFETDDSVVVKIGGLKVEVNDNANTNANTVTINADADKDKKKKRSAVEPTFAGLRVGLNNLMFGNRIGGVNPHYRNLELITGKSVNVNIGLVGVRVRLGTDAVSLNTGFALDINNYRFRSDSVLKPRVDNVQFYSRNEQGDVTKNKLAATYLEVPVKLQLAFGGNSSQAAKLGFGFRAAYLLGAHTKVVVNDEKEKVRDDFNLTTLKYGLVGQIGFGWFNFYVNYDLTPLFNEGVQPDLRPVAAGVILTGW